MKHKIRVCHCFYGLFVGLGLVTILLSGCAIEIALPTNDYMLKGAFPGTSLPDTNLDERLIKESRAEATESFDFAPFNLRTEMRDVIKTISDLTMDARSAWRKGGIQTPVYNRVTLTAQGNLTKALNLISSGRATDELLTDLIGICEWMRGELQIAGRTCQ